MDNRRLVEKVAANMGRSTADVNKLLDALAGVLQARCSEMNSVAVPAFGSFEPTMQHERVQTQPDGKRWLMPPQVTLDFKASRVLETKLK